MIKSLTINLSDVSENIVSDVFENIINGFFENKIKDIFKNAVKYNKMNILSDSAKKNKNKCIKCSELFMSKQEQCLYEI